MTRTASQRAADAERRKLAAGWRRVHAVISPEAALALDSLTRDGATTREVIERALIESATRVTVPVAQ